MKYSKFLFNLYIIKSNNIIMKKLNGKIILITGASSGIGRQTCIDLLKLEPKALIIVSRSKERLNQVAKETDSRSEIVIHPCDISKKNSVMEMSEIVLDQFGKIDILINNAGIGTYGYVQDQTIDDIERVMNINYFGMVYCTKAFLNSMINHKSGKIINVASLAASFGIPKMASYCASKFAMLGFSESLSYELKNSGVGITVVSPIAVKTNFFENESFKNELPNKIGFALDPKTVSKAIISAIKSNRIEIVVPFFARAAVWTKHTIPYLINPIISSSFK